MLKPSLDDLGLSAPGTRNITIFHKFNYFNYSEIQILNSNSEYRFEKNLYKEDTENKPESFYTDEHK